jgi:hypothetical protein
MMGLSGPEETSLKKYRWRLGSPHMVDKRLYAIWGRMPRSGFDLRYFIFTYFIFAYFISTTETIY